MAHPIHARVIARNGENAEKLTRRFLRKVAESHILQETKKHTAFSSKSEQRREKKAKAIRRAKARQARKNLS